MPMCNKGTKVTINLGLKKCLFAKANLQNHKRVKIRKEDMISQQFFRPQNLCYVYNIYKIKGCKIFGFRQGYLHKL